MFIYAIYASIATVFVAYRMPRLADTLGKGVDLIEYLGQFLVSIIPFLMVAIGAYVTILPEVLAESLGPEMKMPESVRYPY